MAERLEAGGRGGEGAEPVEAVVVELELGGRDREAVARLGERVAADGESTEGVL